MDDWCHHWSDIDEWYCLREVQSIAHRFVRLWCSREKSKTRWALISRCVTLNQISINKSKHSQINQWRSLKWQPISIKKWISSSREMEGIGRASTHEIQRSVMICWLYREVVVEPSRSLVVRMSRTLHHRISPWFPRYKGIRIIRGASRIAHWSGVGNDEMEENEPIQINHQFKQTKNQSNISERVALLARNTKWKK